MVIEPVRFSVTVWLCVPRLLFSSVPPETSAFYPCYAQTGLYWRRLSCSSKRTIWHDIKLSLLVSLSLFLFLSVLAKLTQSKLFRGLCFLGFGFVCFVFPYCVPALLLSLFFLPSTSTLTVCVRACVCVFSNQFYACYPVFSPHSLLLSFSTHLPVTQQDIFLDMCLFCMFIYNCVELCSFCMHYLLVTVLNYLTLTITKPYLV